MPITHLVVGNFRNLTRADFHPGRVSFIYGENGSGKTSLLEAVSTLALGRSFRTRKFRNLIAYNQAELQLFCEFHHDGLPQRLGTVRKADGSSAFRMNDSAVLSASDLAAALPCQIINNDSFSLLEGGPGERRHFLDWLAFHVKPDFQQCWGEYNRCLKQRNSLLRSDRLRELDLEVWNQSLAKLGERIDCFRAETLELLLSDANALIRECDFACSGLLSVLYQPGWDKQQSLLALLESHINRDVSLGHTSVGPHKADIKFTFNQKPVAEIFSRGQLKALIAALYVSQVRVFQRYNPRTCILLVDDLPAEVDQINLQLLCRWLSSLENIQIFITGVDLKTTMSYWPSNREHKLFHVKQGQIIEQQAIGAIS